MAYPEPPDHTGKAPEHRDAALKAQAGKANNTPMITTVKKVTRTTYKTEPDGFELTFEPHPNTATVKETKDGYEIKYITVDNDPQNPREDDNIGTMVAFHRRYTLGDKGHGYKESNIESWADLKQQIEENEDAAVILPLYLYDHSGITIRTTPFGDRWDSGQVGFIFVSKKKVIEEYDNLSPDSIEKAKKYLIGEVETYDQYLTGDVYTLVKETFDKDKDQLTHDTVGGYYGLDYAKADLKTFEG